MSSSDLDLARALSRLLSETPAAGPADGRALSRAVEPPDPTKFLRFRRAADDVTPLARRAEPTPGGAVPRVAREGATGGAAPPPAVEVAGFDAETLTPLLEEARKAAGADSAFLANPLGVVVSVGSLATDAAARSLPRLGVVLEGARSVSGTGLEETAVVVESGGRALTAFVATAPDGEHLTIAFEGPSPTPRPIRDALRRVLAGR